MSTLELEKTYLAKSIPEGVLEGKNKELIDIYIPFTAEHPKLRLRKKGNTYELTKKTLVDPNDASTQIEQNVELSEDEFNGLAAAGGKTVHKIRYYYDYNGRQAEIDVFQGDLKGLVLVDFEFETPEEQKAFVMPDFCLEDVTQEDFIAGGMLCGKSYSDIEADLNRFNYKQL
jgi:CYTH domain-containing protein